MEKPVADNQVKIQSIDDQNYHSFPKEVQEVYLFLKENDEKVLSPAKYYAAQKTLIRYELLEYHKKLPDQPLRDVVVEVIQKLPPFIPAEKILELTEFTLQTWEEISEKAAMVY